MAFFLDSLNRSGHLDGIYLTLCIAGSRKLKEFNEDYAEQGWKIFGSRLSIYGFDADRTACEAMNAELAAKPVNWNEKHIPLALWNSSGQSTLYLTKFPGRSSLYPPNPAYCERFISNSKGLEVVSTVEVEMTTLDLFCKTEGIEEVDFLQVDVQGGDLHVLEGASQLLNQSILSVVTEVEFMRLYKNQPLFGDVDVYLRKQGFTLFDLANIHRDMRRRSILVPKEHPGPLLWADAFYFRDLLEANGELELKWKTPERLVKLACIADILNFNDYCLEILEYLTLEYGKDEKYNFADNIIESLAQIPEIVESGLESLDIVARIRDYVSSYRFSSSSSLTQKSPEAISHRETIKPTESVPNSLLLKLRNINLIVFPDWSQPEESLSLDLERVLRAIAIHPDKSQLALLISTIGISEEDANLILSGVVMNLLMQEDLNVTEEAEISLVGQLDKIHWEALLPRIQARIVLEQENRKAIDLVKATTLPCYTLNSRI